MVMWRKSSYSGTNGCVQVASATDGVLVRDTKHPDGPMLTFTSVEWAAFILGAKAGEFDVPTQGVRPMSMEPLNAQHSEAREEAWLHWSQDLPAEVLPDARAAWEKTIQAQLIDLRFANAGFAEALFGWPSRWLAGKRGPKVSDL